ncbi:MAG TPA: hypothetical protein VFY90_08465 [Tepidiformaceae bacterium]|nr:hypothetical protein [Tepidiformaceae bacterium]
MHAAEWGRHRESATIQHEHITQLGWYAGGVLLGFVVPFLFTSVFDLNHDLYYGIYFAAVGVFLGAYVRWTGLDVAELFRRNWKWSLVLGAIAAVLLVFNVYRREDATPRPDGAYFLFSLGWRGVLYGTVDALLLSAFPVAVAYALVSGRLDGIARKASFGALALGLTLVITATYHLGYEQYRDDGIGGPETGNAIISLPAILTANPLGSVIAHASMHVAADAHAYETDVFLPPKTES